MDCRTVEVCNFKKRLEFNLHDVINTKQQTITEKVKKIFEGEDIQTDYKTPGLDC